MVTDVTDFSVFHARARARAPEKKIRKSVTSVTRHPIRHQWAACTNSYHHVHLAGGVWWLSVTLHLPPCNWYISGGIMVQDAYRSLLRPLQDIA